MKIRIIYLLCVMLSVVMAGQAGASVMFTISPNATPADRIATFNSLTSNGISLSSYSENQLSVTVADINFQGNTPFSPGDLRSTGFHYGSGGNFSFVDIKGTDGAKFKTSNFLLGSGFSDTITNLRWETRRNGLLTGSGTEFLVPKGRLVGWADALGFDDLRVAAYSTPIGSPAPVFGNLQAIAIDDLRVQLLNTASVPVFEPASIVMLGLGTIGAVFARSRKRN